MDRVVSVRRPKSPARGLLAAGLLTAALLLPLIVSDNYVLHMLLLVYFWIAMGQAWNLVGGLAGQLSLGHAAFFGTGAYTVAILAEKLHVSVWLGLIAAGVIGAALAVPVGLISFRTRGPYLTLVTLTIGEVLRLLADHFDTLTNGPSGILLIPPFLSKVPYYYLALGLAVVLHLLVTWIHRSRMGFYLLAIREDEDAAEALGVSPGRYKLLALVMSAAGVAVLGGFYALYITFIQPQVVFNVVDISIAVALVVVLGGSGTVWGPVIGAATMTLVSEFLRANIGGGHLIVYGVAVVLTCVFLPEGLISLARGRLMRLRPGTP